MRERYLDIAKALGVIVVVMSHTCGIYKIGSLLTAGYMPLFFLLSGFFYKKRNIKESILRRIKRLLIPYVQMSVALMVLHYPIQISHGEEISLNNIYNYVRECIYGMLYSRYAMHFPLSQGEQPLLFFDNEALWFLTALLVSTIIAILCLHFCKKKIQMIICIGGMILISFILSDIPILLPWSIDTAFMGAIFFLIGYCLRQNNLLVFKFNTKNIFVYVGLVIVYVGLLHFNNEVINMSVRLYGAGIFFFIATGVLCTTMYVFMGGLLQNTKLGAYLNIVGNHTLALFGFHIVFYHYFYEFIIPFFNLTGRLKSVLNYIFVIAIIVFIVYGAECFHKWKQKQL